MYSTSSVDIILIPKIVAEESRSQWATRTLFHNSPSHIQLFQSYQNWEYKRNAFTNIMLAGRKSVKKMQSILVPGAPPLWGTTAPFATIGPPLSC